MVTITPSERFTPYSPVVPTTVFAVGFPIFDNADVTLTHNGSAYSQFTVSGTFVDGVCADAMIHTDVGLVGEVTVIGNRVPRREDQYGVGKPLPVNDHNYSLNRLTVESQEHSRETQRALKLPVGTVSLDLPLPERGKALVGNAAGDGYINAPVGEGDIAVAVEEAEAARNAAVVAKDIAAQKADISTSEAAQSKQERIAAELAAQIAITAKDAAFVNAAVYSDIAAGLAATVSGGQFQVVSGDEIIRYRNNSGSAVEVARYPSAQSVLNAGNIAKVLDNYGTGAERFTALAARRAATSRKSIIVILLGQSLNAPWQSAVVKTAPSGCRMMVGGAAVTEFSFASVNVLFTAGWASVASDIDFTEGVGQTPLVGIGSTLAGGKWARTYLASAAIGARTAFTLSQSGPRANVQALISRATAISRASGYEPDIVFYSAHGEADGRAATTEEVYYNTASDWYRNMQLIAAQVLGRPDYIAPLFLTYPVQQNAGDNGARDRDIKKAIRRVARDLAGAVDLGSIYQWPCGTDRVHPTVESFVKRGEAVGKAIREYFDNGKTWGEDLKIVDVTLSGVAFTARFNKDVVRDTTLGVGQNLNVPLAKDGLEWIDNGNQIGITALTYAGSRIIGTLASAPTGTLAQQVLRVAEQTTTASSTAGAANLSGSVIRAVGDGWPSIQEPTYINHIWAAPQSFASVRTAS